jgi:hypothetical protein
MIIGNAANYSNLLNYSIQSIAIRQTIDILICSFSVTGLAMPIAKF